jgi:PAS domain S-box-containing protein
MQHRQIQHLVLGYLLVGTLYILFSDQLLYLIAPDLEALKSISILKGLGFVAVTATTLWLLLLRLNREEHQRYQALVEQHHAIMLLIDPDNGDILDANKTAAEFYGYELKKLRGMHISTLNRRTREQVVVIMAKAMKNEQAVFHLKHWLASGAERDVLVMTGPVTHMGRKLLLSIVQDETDSKRYQRELERSNRLLGMLSEFNQSVVRATDRNQLFQAACTLAVSHGGFKFAWVGMINPDDVITPIARAGEDAGYVDQVHASLSASSIRGLGPTGVALRTGSPVINNDFLGDPHTIIWHAAAERAGIRSSVALPIRDGATLIGTLNFYAEESGYFGPREQQTLMTVADDLQYALKHLDSLRALQVTANVVEASPAVLFRWRNAPDWPVLFVTDNVTNWGYSAAGLKSGRVLFSQLVHPDDLQRVGEEVTGYLAAKAEHYAQEYRIITADQRVRWVSDQTSVSYDAAGEPEFLQGVLTDTTDKKESERTIQDYVERLEKAFLGTTLAVSQLVELRDPYTAGHEKRVGELAAAIAAELGYDEHMQNGLRAAGALHDVGKIMVPVEILSKPGKLTANEFDLIRMHPDEGYKVLKEVPFPWPIADVARQHHERLDGSGYPQGLKGEQICLEARIIAVADVVESMSSHRPYRAARGIGQGLAEIEAGSGSLFDARVVAACLCLFREKGFMLEPSLFGAHESVDR